MACRMYLKSMRTTIILLLLFPVVTACFPGKCIDMACYPGAPSVTVFFATTDSSYLDIAEWKVYDSGNPVNLYIEGQIVGETIADYMELSSSADGVTFTGDAVIWENLDDLKVDLVVDFGNGEEATLDIHIGEGRENCCDFHFIRAARFNDTELVDLGGGSFEVVLN